MTTRMLDPETGQAAKCRCGQCDRVIRDPWTLRRTDGHRCEDCYRKRHFKVNADSKSRFESTLVWEGRLWA